MNFGVIFDTKKIANIEQYDATPLSSKKIHHFVIMREFT